MNNLMQMEQIMRAYPAVFALTLAMMASCSSGSSDGEKEKAPAEASSTPCGPVQEMAAHTAVWSFYKCGGAGNFYITPDTLDPDTGQQLGTRSMNRAMLSFRFTDMHNEKVSERENFGAFFMAKGENGGEVNWQWMSYNIGEGKIQSRLIIQRFDGTCGHGYFCEQSYITNEVQFNDPAEVWQWDCQWNRDNSYIICDIFKPFDPGFKVVRAWNQMLGNYYELHYIGLGNSAYQGPYPGYDGTVSDIKMTVFE